MMRDAVDSTSEIQREDTQGRTRQLCLRNDVSQHWHGLKYGFARYGAVLAGC